LFRLSVASGLPPNNLYGIDECTRTSTHTYHFARGGSRLSPFLILKRKNDMTKFKCPCKYTYDPEKGDPKQNIPPGTPFEELPDTWRCPRCKRKKEKFVPVEE